MLFVPLFYLFFLFLLLFISIIFWFGGLLIVIFNAQSVLTISLGSFFITIHHPFLSRFALILEKLPFISL